MFPAEQVQNDRVGLFLLISVINLHQLCVYTKATWVGVPVPDATATQV